MIFERLGSKKDVITKVVALSHLFREIAFQFVREDLKNGNHISLYAENTIDSFRDALHVFRLIKQIPLRHLHLAKKIRKDLSKLDIQSICYCFPLLTSLSLNDTKADDNALDILPTNLTYLDLSRCHFITNKGIESLSSLSSLKRLDLVDVACVSRTTLQILNHMPQLEFVNFDCCPGLDAQDFSGYSPSFDLRAECLGSDGAWVQKIPSPEREKTVYCRVM